MIRAAALVVAALAAAPIVHADTIVELQNAWVRSANVGQAGTPLYVDITTNAPLTLVGATSDVSASARLMVTERRPEREVAKPVGSLDVAANTKFRLAPRGPFVELRDVKQVVRTGDSVSFRLDFTDAAGKPVRASGEALVRGIMPRPDEYETEPSAEQPPAAPK